MIPTEDFTDVALASEDTGDPDDPDNPEKRRGVMACGFSAVEMFLNKSRTCIALPFISAS